jgi:hypothetical protein
MPDERCRVSRQRYVRSKVILARVQHPGKATQISSLFLHVMALQCVLVDPMMSLIANQEAEVYPNVGEERSCR